MIQSNSDDNNQLFKIVISKFDDGNKSIQVETKSMILETLTNFLEKFQTSSESV